jgi:hypothetical protein
MAESLRNLRDREKLTGLCEIFIWYSQLAANEEREREREREKMEAKSGTEQQGRIAAVKSIRAVFDANVKNYV